LAAVHTVLRDIADSHPFGDVVDVPEAPRCAMVVGVARQPLKRIRDAVAADGLLVAPAVWASLQGAGVARITPLCGHHAVGMPNGAIRMQVWRHLGGSGDARARRRRSNLHSH
jgi:hypothetical protein